MCRLLGSSPLELCSQCGLPWAECEALGDPMKGSDHAMASATEATADVVADVPDDLELDSVIF